jgi:hypothetical protein
VLTPFLPVLKAPLSIAHLALSKPYLSRRRGLFEEIRYPIFEVGSCPYFKIAQNVSMFKKGKGITFFNARQVTRFTSTNVFEFYSN